DLESLDAAMTKARYGTGTPYISVRGKIRGLLASRTFVKKVFEIVISGGGEGEINTGRLKEQQPWHHDVSVILGPAYELTSTPLQKYKAALMAPNFTLIEFSENGPLASGLFFLDNTEHARVRDVRILYAGALFATAAAVFTEFLVDVASLMRRRE